MPQCSAVIFANSNPFRESNLISNGDPNCIAHGGPVAKANCIAHGRSFCKPHASPIRLSLGKTNRSTINQSYGGTHSGTNSMANNIVTHRCADIKSNVSSYCVTNTWLLCWHTGPVIVRLSRL